jgi:hypothetical protein
MSFSHSEQLNELGAALAKAQAIMATAKKDSQNPFFRSSYADLASVWEACREPLTQNGLSIAQFPGFEPGNPPTALVTTILLHVSGQWMAETAGAPLPDQTRKDGSVEKANAQGVGSAITYLRRYALAAVASVSPADDDGNVASGKKSERGGAATPRGTVAKEPVAPTPQSLTERPKALTEEPVPWGAGAKLWPVGDKKGMALKDLPSADLVAALAWIKKTGRYAEFQEPIEEVLAGREGE